MISFYLFFFGEFVSVRMRFCFCINVLRERVSFQMVFFFFKQAKLHLYVCISAHLIFILLIRAFRFRCAIVLYIFIGYLWVT